METTTYEKSTVLQALLVLYYVLCSGISLFEDNYPYLKKTRWSFPTLGIFIVTEPQRGVEVE